MKVRNLRASVSNELPKQSQTEKTLRVLVVDDDADTCASIQDLLNASGCEAEAAINGARAIGQAILDKPDLVLCDLNMDGINGFEVAKELRSLGRTKDIRLIAVSGLSDDASRDKAMRAGFDAYIVKPPTMDDILSLLDVPADGQHP